MLHKASVHIYTHFLSIAFGYNYLKMIVSTISIWISLSLIRPLDLVVIKF